MPRVTVARQRVIDYLLQNGPVEDRSGRATRILKEAIGYDSSDAAFGQLIGSMEKAGELTREIRGKRTYRISRADDASTRTEGQTGGSISEDIDYDELAFTLLARVAQILSTSQGSADPAAWAQRRIRNLEGRLDDLQQEVARAKAEAKANADERDELREQLDAASRNLDLLTDRLETPKRGRGPAAGRLGSAEQALLYDLRSSQRSSGSRSGRAG